MSQPSTTSFPTLFQTATFLSLTTSLGGLTGYIRTASTPSLVAGLTIGGLYALSAYRIRNNQPYAVETALLASLVLGGSSVPRVIRTAGRKPLPIVLSAMAALGLWRFGREVLGRR